MTYELFAPFCECTHKDGTFKGLKMLACNTFECMKVSSMRRSGNKEENSEEPVREEVTPTAQES